MTRVVTDSPDPRPAFCSDSDDHCLRGDCGQCRGEPTPDDLSWLEARGYSLEEAL